MDELNPSNDDVLVFLNGNEDVVRPGVFDELESAYASGYTATSGEVFSHKGSIRYTPDSMNQIMGLQAVFYFKLGESDGV